MGFLKKLFGTRQPAPRVEIHPDDKELVRDEDVAWWNSLSLEDVVALEEQDRIFRFAHWKKPVESEGLSDKEAGEKVRRAWPYFYARLSDREGEKIALSVPDAALPVVLKDRVNRAINNVVITKQAVNESSSVNALIRSLIQLGRI